MGPICSCGHVPTFRLPPYIYTRVYILLLLFYAGLIAFYIYKYVCLQVFIWGKDDGDRPAVCLIFGVWAFKRILFKHFRRRPGRALANCMVLYYLLVTYYFIKSNSYMYVYLYFYICIYIYTLDFVRLPQEFRTWGL